MEQEYILKNIKSFELEHIFECGQCFRWQKNKDKSYTIIFQKNILNIKKGKDGIYFKGICKGDIKDNIFKYFDLNKDYEKIKKELSKKDEYLKEAIKYGYGIRILKQDLWETIISFIISSNNNIPRIKGIIEKLSQKYGTKVEMNKNIYYLFPTPNQLSKASIQDLRNIGLGFRDKRIYNFTQDIVNKKIDLKEFEKIDNIEILKSKLEKIEGIGPKVAGCIMLFSLAKFEIFPVDVWVKRVINELYLHQNNESKIKIKDVEKLAKEKFGNLARYSTTIFILF